MKDEQLMETWRNAMEESVVFFSSANKGGLERWVCTDFFTKLDLCFHAAEVVLQTDDPPDVLFRHASRSKKFLMPEDGDTTSIGKV